MCQPTLYTPKRPRLNENSNSFRRKYTPFQFLLPHVCAIYPAYVGIEDSIKTTQNKEVSQSDSL